MEVFIVQVVMLLAIFHGIEMSRFENSTEEDFNSKILKNFKISYKTDNDQELEESIENNVIYPEPECTKNTLKANESFQKTIFKNDLNIYLTILSSSFSNSTDSKLKSMTLRQFSSLRSIAFNEKVRVALGGTNISCILSLEPICHRIFKTLSHRSLSQEKHANEGHFKATVLLEYKCLGELGTIPDYEVNKLDRRWNFKRGIFLCYFSRSLLLGKEHPDMYKGIFYTQEIKCVAKEEKNKNHLDERKNDDDLGIFDSLLNPKIIFGMTISVLVMSCLKFCYKIFTFCESFKKSGEEDSEKVFTIVLKTEFDENLERIKLKI